MPKNRSERYKEWQANKNHDVGSLAFLSDEEYELAIRNETAKENGWEQRHEEIIKQRKAKAATMKPNYYAKHKG
ncbi:hypothetical protein [Vibrio algicola]|uniref:Uncharacterized protein n=1 Tax=Vibrio algicola TaxID=2662262 RepID=A0A5Q0TD66_9VIBR|nr:hypothetical protein [Vibrio algicola]